MTSLRWNRPKCTPGLLLRLKLVVVFELFEMIGLTINVRSTVLKKGVFQVCK